MFLRVLHCDVPKSPIRDLLLRRRWNSLPCDTTSRLGGASTRLTGLGGTSLLRVGRDVFLGYFSGSQIYRSLLLYGPVKDGEVGEDEETRSKLKVDNGGTLSGVRF